MPGPQPPQRVLIVGAGEFGSITALSLIKGPYKGHGELITMIDRSDDPPAVDAASSDFNKIIRQEYTDEFYARLAHSALLEWRKPEWNANLHESGIVVSISSDSPHADYIAKSLEMNAQPFMATGKEAYVIHGAEEAQKEYGKGVELGDFARQNLYINHAGGWGFSRGAVVNVIKRLRKEKVQFVAGEVADLLYRRNQHHNKLDTKGTFDVSGVVTKDGRSFCADFVVLTVGSWTPTLLPELAHELLPTGQVVGTLQLNEEQYERYKNVPVTRLIDNMFYIFPPNPDGIVKFAIHQKGYLNPQGGLPSVPRTSLTPGFEDQQVPEDARRALHSALARIYPELAKLPWKGSRMCWYSDRPSGDFLFDYHPEFPSLFIAAGCCGHGFKFMPILGDLITNGIYDKLQPDQKAMFAYHHGVPDRKDNSRYQSTYKILQKNQHLAHL